MHSPTHTQGKWMIQSAPRRQDSWEPPQNSAYLIVDDQFSDETNYVRLIFLSEVTHHTTLQQLCKRQKMNSEFINLILGLFLATPQGPF